MTDLAETDGLALRARMGDRIKDLILQRIVSGVYPPGSRLVQTRIAEELKVSQASVREALFDLEHLGCVVHEPYRGCTVRRFSIDELLEAFPVRAALEALAAELAAAAMTDDQLRELEQLYDKMLIAARRGDPHDHSLVDASFHSAIVHGARNATLERQWSLLEPTARTYITVSRPGIDLVALTEEHIPILNALKARNRKAAAKAMRDHLLHAAGFLSSHVA